MLPECAGQDGPGYPERSGLTFVGTENIWNLLEIIDGLINQWATLITSQVHVTHTDMNYLDVPSVQRSPFATAVGTVSDPLSKAKFKKGASDSYAACISCGRFFRVYRLPAQRLDGSA